MALKETPAHDKISQLTGDEAKVKLENKHQNRLNKYLSMHK